MLIIGLIIMVLFGAKHLPAIGRSFGSSIFEFKKALNPNGSSQKDTSEDHTQVSKDTPAKTEL